MSSIAAILDSQRRAASPTAPLDERIDRLERLRAVVLRAEDRIVAAISRDFGHRAATESRLYEVHSVVQSVDYLKRCVRNWIEPASRLVAAHFLPGSARVEYQPIGIVGVVSPWNYPVALALNPMAAALAAGNRVMLKPSEKTPETAALLADMLGAAFASDEVAVVTGGESVACRFVSLPFDHLVFTGGTAIGRAVMRAASDHLVPVTLELGGKSPTVIMPDADLAVAAGRIAYGKLANAGQTCIAPDYVLVPETRAAEFASEWQAAVDRMYPDPAVNEDYTAIASDSHRERLDGLLADALERGAAALQGDWRSAVHARVMPPVLLTSVTAEMRVMQEEIFGPILPLVGYTDVDDAIARIARLPRALALYVFGPSGPGRSRVLAETVTGTVAINDTILQYAQEDLPFGGVGPSGMGRYHGREGFEALSNVRGIYEQGEPNLARVARPPFGRLTRWLLRFLNR